MILKNKIIIFDLWQTLADSTLKPSSLFDELFLSEAKVTRKEFLRYLFQSDLYLEDISLEEGIKNFLSGLGIYDKENLKKVVSLWKEMSQKSFLIDGVEKLLLALKAGGYTLCLLTNIDKYGYENFPNKNILRYFDYQFLSYSHCLKKPDTKCWEVIRNHYKTECGNMTMVGDSLEDDILPAKSLGLKTILIDKNKGVDLYDEIYKTFINN
jgi:FMN phosphatase YigB (HAD superfamily)